MKKILLILFLFSIGFSMSAIAETGKNLNWCKQDTKIKYPFYIHGKGKIKKHKSSDKLKDAQNKNINNSENLQNLIKKIIWKKFKLVN